MSLGERELIIRIVAVVISAFGIGALADRKHHSPWLWAGIGGICAALTPLLAVVPLLIVGFLKYRCPKCGTSVSNEAARSGACLKCDAAPSIPT
ncbi:MAG TPA: hypothetical protein VGM84_26855 [Steroidobacteraceae bacterium]